MSTCVTKQQWAEVYKREQNKLRALELEGYDITDAVNDLEAMNRSFNAGKLAEARKIAQEHTKGFTPLTGSEVARVNKNKPRVRKAPVKVVGGYKTDTNVIYEVKYPNSDKKYTFNDWEVSLDQMDAKYGVIFGNEPGSQDSIGKHHQELKENLWNDQGAALKLFDELAALDHGADPQHLVELKALLTDITDPTKQVLNEFKTYINKEAEANNGIAVATGKDPKIKLDINTSNMTQGMSAAEMYVHEMLHMSTEVARSMKGQVASVMQDMNQLYLHAAENIKVADLVENGDVERAERMWGYMFDNPETGISEFIAYSMTNKAMKDALKKLKSADAKEELATDTVWDKAVWLVRKLYEAIRGTYLSTVKGRANKGDVQEHIATLVTELWDLNNRTVDEKQLSTRIVAGVQDVQDKVDTKLREAAGFAGDVIGLGLDTVEKYGPGSYTKTAAKAIKTAGRILDPNEAEDSKAATAEAFRQFSTAFEGWGGSVFRAEGSLRGAMSYLKDDDDVQRRVEKMGLIAMGIERHRMNMVTAIGQPLLEGLGKASKAEQAALTEVLLELDVKSLKGVYNLQEVKAMLEDNAKLEEAIDKHLKKLDSLESNEGIKNYYRAQVKGLGVYMATGRGASSLNVAANEIADMSFTSHYRGNKYENRAELMSTIDTLATLEGIRNASASAKNLTAQMIEKRPEGVQNVLDVAELHAAMDTIYRVEHNIKVRATKGSIKEVRAPWIETTISTDNEVTKKLMKKRGFKYVGPAHVEGMGIYKKVTSGMEGFDKQALAKINETKNIRSMTAIYNEAARNSGVELTAQEIWKKATKEKIKLDTKANIDIERQMETGEMPDMDGYLGTLSKDGTLDDYGITADKKVFGDAVGQRKGAPEVLGKMIAEIEEKDMASKHNAMVWQEMLMESRKYKQRGRLGTDNREYIEIGPDAISMDNGKDTVGKEFAKRLERDMPENIKRELNKLPKGRRYIAVRRDLARGWFGMRSPSLLNAKIPFTGKSVERVLNEHGLGIAVEGMKLAGDIWQEIISIIKVDIVLKTPKVLIDNITSNINYSIALGQWPWDAVKSQVQMFEATKAFIDHEKQIEKLKVEINLGRNVKENKQKVRQLRALMNDSPVKPLMDAGLFTSILEDLKLKELKSDTRFRAGIDKYTQKVPSIIKDTVGTLYVTQDTEIFNAMMMATAYSDFVARASRYHVLIAKGMDEKVATKMVLDEFVNYNRILGPTFTWLKEMGLSQFHQYFFGAMKSMARKLKDRPSSMLMLGMFVDAPSPWDAMPGQRDLTTNFHSPWDILTNQIPKHIPNPSLLEVVGIKPI